MLLFVFLFTHYIYYTSHFYYYYIWFHVRLNLFGTVKPNSCLLCTVRLQFTARSSW